MMRHPPRLGWEFAAPLRPGVARVRLAARVFGATTEGILIVSPTLCILEAHEAMRRALAALVEPVAIPSGAVTVGASMGLACYPRDGGDPATLLRLSDAAMYRAKRAGPNRLAAVGGEGGEGCARTHHRNRRNA